MMEFRDIRTSYGYKSFSSSVANECRNSILHKILLKNDFLKYFEHMYVKPNWFKPRFQIESEILKCIVFLVEFLRVKYDDFNVLKTDDNTFTVYLMLYYCTIIDILYSKSR